MKHKATKIFLIVTVIFILLVLLFIGGIVIYAKTNVDFETDEALFMKAQEDKSISFYYDENGNDTLDNYVPVLFEELKLTRENGKWYSYNEFSSYLREGFIAMEDRGFFSHHGIDIKRTIAAASNYIFRREKSFGGSTITQQVIKNISGDNEKTVKRKLDELIRAYHIELSHSKEEIFEVYLNIIPMSNNILGIGAAAEAFFGKSPSQLGAAEAATLIAVANAPSRYNPYKNTDECLKKRNRVLYVMHEAGIIDYESYVQAKNTPIIISARSDTSANSVSWFAETVIEDVISDLMNKHECSYEAAKLILYKNGAKIYTTVAPDVQKTLESYFENTDNFPDECMNGLDYSMVVCDSQRNLLRGVVGSVGKKRKNSAYNNATLLHTPGSVLKPLALYLPLIDMREITWSTVFDDVPVTFIKNSDGSFTEFPKNYPERYDGLTTVSDALRISKNTVAVKLYNKLGPERIYKYLTDNFKFNSLVLSEKRNSGVITDLAPSPLALGQLSRGVSLKKLTEAYTVFPGDGIMNRSRSYIAVFNSNEESLVIKNREEHRVSSCEAARVMTQLMSQVVENGTASKITLKNIYDTAGKTGTSGNDRDRMFIGYTPYYTAGIWCGYNDKSASVGNHEKNHLTVWDSVMKQIHEKCTDAAEEERNFSVSGLVYVPYCMDSGKQFSLKCSYDPRGERVSFGYFIKGTEPYEECDAHILLYENLFPFLSKISLLDIEKREFPKEITVADEKYVYRKNKERKIK